VDHLLDQLVDPAGGLAGKDVLRDVVQDDRRHMPGLVHAREILRIVQADPFAGDTAVLVVHWQTPLFQALDRRESRI